MTTTRCAHCGIEIESTALPGIGAGIMSTIWFDPTVPEAEPDVFCNGVDGQRHEP